jgi:hypothetical protein
MRRLIRIFVLSKSEQRVVLIVVLALIVGALIRYDRRVHQFPVQPPTATELKTSPNPTEADDEQ